MGITLFFRCLGVRHTVQNASRAISTAALLVAGACGDTNSFLSPASIENVDRQYEVWAMTGTSAALPAGYQFTSESLVRPQVLSSGEVNFDVAFDLDASGKVVVLPVRLVSPLPPARSPSIGFLRWPAAYEQLIKASTTGYVFDSAAVLAVGESIAVQLPNSNCLLGDPYYAKFTVDSIDPVNRRMLVRALVNRNCGYRALSIGLPKD